MSFQWTGSGLNQLSSKKDVSIDDFILTQDGPDRWVFRRGGSKTTFAVFTGNTAAEAIKALKLALVTHRFTS